jgi:hypothetical protein
VLANGDTYSGGVEDGLFKGRGIYINNPKGPFGGQRYEGGFRAGRRDGEGVMNYQNGDRYVGEFKADKKNGKGTLFFASGAKFIGTFKDGKRNGEGTLYASSGSIEREGRWKDDVFVD